MDRLASPGKLIASRSHEQRAQFDRSGMFKNPMDCAPLHFRRLLRLQPSGMRDAFALSQASNDWSAGFSARATSGER